MFSSYKGLIERLEDLEKKVDGIKRLHQEYTETRYRVSIGFGSPVYDYSYGSGKIFDKNLIIGEGFISVDYAVKFIEKMRKNNKSKREYNCEIEKYDVDIIKHMESEIKNV